MTIYRKNTFFKKILFWCSAMFLLFIIISAAAGPFFLSSSPYEKDLQNRRLFPGENGRLLGSDNLGRDIMARIVHGSRITLIAGFISRSIALLFGMTLGIISAWSKGFLDMVIMRITDSFLAFPSLLLAIGISLALGPGMWTVIFSLALAGWADIARITRGCVLNISENDYIHASKAYGAGSFHIVFFHIIPNLVPSLLVVWAMGISTSIMGEASLSFLGLGVAPPTPSWGSMVQRGFTCLSSAPWIALIPGFFISATVVSINIISDQLNDYINPLSGNREVKNAF
jgi:peptide/nickel transport system permease protein